VSLASITSELDLAIRHLAKIDGCAGQARA
jgi:hypothetical protein